MTDVLTARRMDLGLSRAELAEKCGVAPETIRKIESGHRPTARVGKKVADFFGCRYTDLWPIENPEEIPA